MICPGLHCPGCSDGQSLGILAAAVAALVLADRVVPWVADRIFWIGGTLALCFALATAASMWLETRTRRREAAWGAARGILSRADVILPVPSREPVAAAVLPQAVTAAQPATIAAPQVVNVFNVFGVPAAQAAVIRTMLPGQAGDAITEGKPQP